jgi:arylsulfatase A-like enzyme
MTINCTLAILDGIRRRSAAMVSLLACAMLLGGSCLGCRSSEASGPSRIIFIVVDTLRADKNGSSGATSFTPHMDRLTREGQEFREARSAFHFTSMSMASMFTGLVPSFETGEDNGSLPTSSETYCGMARFRTPEDSACLPGQLDTLAESMRSAGYWTLGVVGNPLLFDPYGFSQGFDQWIEVGTIPGGLFRTGSQSHHAEERAGDRINSAIYAALDQRPSDHFFLYAHYLDVHDWLLRRHGYKHGVEVFDVFLGELLSDLERRNLLEGAVIILTSDHGEALGEIHVREPQPLHFGNPSYDPVLRVPLIVRPAHFEDSSLPIRGRDMKRLILSLLDPREQGERVRFVPESENYFSEQKYQILQLGRWKSFWSRDGSHRFLVDLRNDPAETRDVAEANPEILAAHRSRVDVLAKELSADPRSLFQDLSDEDRARLGILGYLDENDSRDD